MGIKNGDLPDADEVMNALGLNFKNTSNLLWNASLIGYNTALIESFKNLDQDDLDDNSQINIVNSDIKDEPVFPAAVMDNHDDSSVDSNIWDTAVGAVGSVTENTSIMLVDATTGTAAASASATGDQVNSVDLNSDGIVFFVKIQSIQANNSGAQVALATITITDDSANSVTIYSVDQNGTNLGETIWRLNINTGDNTMGIHRNDITNTGDTGTDISSLVDGDTWHIKYSASHNSHGTPIGASVSVFFERYLDSAVETDDFISTGTEDTAEITNAILSVSEDIGAGGINYFLSADSGLNYEAVTQDSVHRFTNTGSLIKMKASMTSTGSDMPILWHHATTYNFY